jgi:hypothetical protein
LYRIDALNGSECPSVSNTLPVTLKTVHTTNGRTAFDVSPTTGNLLVCIHYAYALAESSDRGNSWTLTNLTGYPSFIIDAYPFVFPNDDNRVLLLTRDNFLLVPNRSNGSIVVLPVNSTFHAQIIFDPVRPETVYSTVGYYSTDNGRNW